MKTIKCSHCGAEDDFFYMTTAEIEAEYDELLNEFVFGRVYPNTIDLDMFCYYCGKQVDETELLRD